MRTPLDRVTVTIPRDVLKAADALAAKERRSRSWVVAEALRRYVEAPKPPGAVQERVAHYIAGTGLGQQRTAQLEADLKLTPAQRVREAEEGFRAALSARPQPRREQVLLFRNIEDYFAWKKTDILL